MSVTPEILRSAGETLRIQQGEMRSRLDGFRSAHLVWSTEIGQASMVWTGPRSDAVCSAGLAYVRGVAQTIPDQLQRAETEIRRLADVAEDLSGKLRAARDAIAHLRGDINRHRHNMGTEPDPSHRRHLHTMEGWLSSAQQDRRNIEAAWSHACQAFSTNLKGIADALTQRPDIARDRLHLENMEFTQAKWQRFQVPRMTPTELRDWWGQLDEHQRETLMKDRPDLFANYIKDIATDADRQQFARINRYPVYTRAFTPGLGGGAAPSRSSA